jgi:hypothetical protein
MAWLPSALAQQNKSIILPPNPHFVAERRIWNSNKAAPRITNQRKRKREERGNRFTRYISASFLSVTATNPFTLLPTHQRPSL